MTNRCIDLGLGQKVLSYDLLQGEEKALVDAHLEVCEACRDFKQQVYGKEGALDELNWRAWKLGQRQRVEPGWWIAARLRDLWIPLLAIVFVIGIGIVLVAQRGAGRDTVRILRFAVMRGLTLDSLASPHADAGPNGLVLRTDRDARLYVYEVYEGSLRRLVPGSVAAPPELVREEAREVPLPEIEHRDARLVLLVVPRDAPGSLDEWDAAAFASLSRSGRASPSGSWPGGVQPTMRVYP